MHIRISPDKGRTALEILRERQFSERGIAVSAPCGGHGFCGKCRIRVVSGEAPISPQDMLLLTPEKIADGIRLACSFVPSGECVIETTAEGVPDKAAVHRCILGSAYETDTRISSVPLPPDTTDLFSAITPQMPFNPLVTKYIAGRCALVAAELVKKGGSKSGSKGVYLPVYMLHDSERLMDISLQPEIPAFGIACDIGTTTIQVSLMDILKGSVIAGTSMMNPQRIFGADVVSRIQAADSGKLTELTRLVIGSLVNTIAALCGEAGVNPDDIRKIVVCGNTVMTYLFAGLSCTALGRFPFMTAVTAPILLSFGDISPGGVCSSLVFLLPGISAFVGGDVLAGMLSLGIDRTSESVFFLDLGTNGEMALALPPLPRTAGSAERIICASAAAGPAFEGGGLSSGCGAIPAAVVSVSLEGGHLAGFVTDSGAAASGKVVGLCGSAYIDALAIALEQGWLLPSGELIPEYAGEGIPVKTGTELRKGIQTFYITQKDIRALQLAIAAIRASAEALLEKTETAPADIACVYIAGSFGSSLNGKHAVRIGLLPEAFWEKITPCGNTALAGAQSVLCNSTGMARLERIRRRAEALSLAEFPGFQELFLRYMNFPPH
ncbi:MAG: ASKHA domain-containing protein [Spirochaetaceae bacterium]|jgi:uncharacterized 2Fe-2S/4Fe-4S cluster protein (DUF4445 family)|nr:ASKHA domain-containing protein [Spirochaetaceae bacterium]